MIRLSEIKLPIDHTEDDIKKAILKNLKIEHKDLISYSIYKQSVDARKEDLYFVYTVDVKIKEEKKILKKSKAKISLTPDLEYKYVNTGSNKLEHRPVIVGTGPAGLFAALILAQMGYAPIVLERGKNVDDRTKDVQRFWKEHKLLPDSNVQFGEGGAGTFSDGKLTTQIRDLRCRKVLEELIQAGAPQEIIYKSKPHVGTDILKVVVKNIREKIIELGGEVYFESKVTELNIENGQVVGATVNDEKFIPSNVVILALGHSARDTFKMLYEKGIIIHQKPFSIGVRIEHPQEMIDQVQYGKYAGHPRLGAADYKLACHCSNGRSAYTFCMCPGGVVVGAASEEGYLVTNGMSEYKRDKENANSALLVGIHPEDFNDNHPLAGIEFQRKWERKAFEAGGSNYCAPAQLVKDFMNGIPSAHIGTVKPSYLPGIKLTDLSLCLPDFVVDTLKEALPLLDQKLKGFSMGDAVMTGVETRSSSPIRIERNKEYESNIKGVYPVGEGAGYAGGIVSAAVDGIKAAEIIASKYLPIL
ncbi:NAD(P)/FAD-dependent oxidoreductase [Defluviitalea saccharophila]|uniref:NAD(P)/FAD-dependent oxidoreductase n=2 Tax=Defluviitalea saccharophila TaxID=879970 RepID=A0ABZ2Y7X9_9FIRM